MPTRADTLALVAVLAGCGSPSPSGSVAAAQRCADPAGAYQICFRLVDGTCADPNCATFTLPANDPTCQNRGAPSADHCSGTVDETCKAADGSAVLTRGDIMSDDTIGASYTSHVEVTVTNPDGSVNCTGHFRLEYKRQ